MNKQDIKNLFEELLKNPSLEAKEKTAKLHNLVYYAFWRMLILHWTKKSKTDEGFKQYVKWLKDAFFAEDWVYICGRIDFVVDDQINDIKLLETFASNFDEQIEKEPWLFVAEAIEMTEEKDYGQICYG